MRISFNGVSEFWVSHAREVSEAVDNVVKKDSYILGNAVVEFETNFQSRLQSKYFVSYGNGLDALVATLMALGVGPEDEVITTPVTAFATTLSILRVGATPVFLDIDPLTGNINPSDLPSKISSRTRALLVVHLYGRDAGAIEWREHSRNTGIPLIEDCSQAHFAVKDSKALGTFGVAGIFSFYPTKNLGCLGDGGGVCTDDDDLAHKLLRIRNYGSLTRYQHEVIGMNSRLDTIQAALLNLRLKQSPDETRRRREAAKFYNRSITNPYIELLEIDESPANVCHLYSVLTKKREAFRLFLKSEGIPTDVHYPAPTHMQQAYLSLFPPKHLAMAEEFCEKQVSLPIHGYITDDELEFIVDVVNRFTP